MPVGRVAPVNQLLEKVLRSGVVRSADGEVLPLHSHIPPEEGRLLQRVVRGSRPPIKVSLEVGLAYGVSAMYICEALREVGADRHIVLDPFQDEQWKGVGLHNLTLSGYADMVRFEPLPSAVALPRLIEEGVRVDFAFVDGFHTFDHTLVEFFYVDMLLRTGGILAFDDADWPSIQKLLRFILTNRAYSVHAALPSTSRRSHPLARGAAWRMLRELGRSSRAGRRIISPRYVADVNLGLEPPTRCIALRKEKPDDRSWDSFQDF
jgi:predicted O-methyltransferase YrrM